MNAADPEPGRTERSILVADGITRSSANPALRLARVALLDDTYTGHGARAAAVLGDG